MKICFPVARDRSLASKLYPHFGSTPMFLVVDTETGTTRAIANGSCEHVHGHCNPLTALVGQHIDAVVVSGIGNGALQRLCDAGVKVYFARPGPIADALEGIANGTVAPIAADEALARGLGCNHGHHHGHGPHQHRHGA